MRGSVRMLPVVTGRASRTALLTGPPPTGIAPVAYSRESRPAARITRNSAAAPSHETAMAASAPMTSSALPTMVSSTWSRSSEEVSDWPIAWMARWKSMLRRRSVTSTRKPTTPATAPASFRHGTQRASIQPLRARLGSAYGNSSVTTI